MENTRINGYILWFDYQSGDGILIDIEQGNQWYFNHWSFSGTHWELENKEKTRYYPGLFRAFKVVYDKRCETIKYGTLIPVTFSQFQQYNGRWAIDVEFSPELKKEVYEYKLMCQLDYWVSGESKFSDEYHNLCVSKTLELIDKA